MCQQINENKTVTYYHDYCLLVYKHHLYLSSFIFCKALHLISVLFQCTRITYYKPVGFTDFLLSLFAFHYPPPSSIPLPCQIRERCGYYKYSGRFVIARTSVHILPIQCALGSQEMVEEEEEEEEEQTEEAAEPEEVGVVGFSDPFMFCTAALQQSPSVRT